jgi:hypothetical protein
MLHWTAAHREARALENAISKCVVAPTELNMRKLRDSAEPFTLFKLFYASTQLSLDLSLMHAHRMLYAVTANREPSVQLFSVIERHLGTLITGSDEDLGKHNVCVCACVCV